MANPVKDFNFNEYPVAISRQGAFPLDRHSLFKTLEEAQEYASSSPLSYVGQIISVAIEDGQSVEVYKIKFDGSLEKIGADVQIDTLSQEEAQSIIDKYKK